MATQTINYDLTKPALEDFYDVSVPNGNMDIIDTELKNVNEKADGIINKYGQPNGIEMDITGVAQNEYGRRTLLEVNLNTVVKAGTYYCQSCTNTPVPYAGYLTVIAHSDTYCYQQYTQASNSNIYIRRLSNGVWSDWTYAMMSQNLVNNHTTTTTGFALDAREAKTIWDKFYNYTSTSAVIAGDGASLISELSLKSFKMGRLYVVSGTFRITSIPQGGGVVHVATIPSYSAVERAIFNSENALGYIDTAGRLYMYYRGMGYVWINSTTIAST